MKGSRTVGYTDACGASAELGMEGTDGATETWETNDTDSAFRFCKKSENQK